MPEARPSPVQCSCTCHLREVSVLLSVPWRAGLFFACQYPTNWTRLAVISFVKPKIIQQLFVFLSLPPLPKWANQTRAVHSQDAIKALSMTGETLLIPACPLSQFRVNTSGKWLLCSRCSAHPPLCWPSKNRWSFGRAGPVHSQSQDKVMRARRGGRYPGMHMRTGGGLPTEGRDWCVAGSWPCAAESQGAQWRRGTVWKRILGGPSATWDVSCVLSVAGGRVVRIFYQERDRVRCSGPRAVILGEDGCGDSVTSAEGGAAVHNSEDIGNWESAKEGWKQEVFRSQNLLFYQLSSCGRQGGPEGRWRMLLLDINRV